MNRRGSRRGKQTGRECERQREGWWRNGVDWPAGSKREVAKKNSRLRTKKRRKSLAERKNGKLEKKFAVGVACSNGHAANQRSQKKAEAF